MIIICINCDKKFELNSDLISEKGRLLQCGSCKYEWFYKKEILNEVHEVDDISSDNSTEVSLFNINTIEDKNDVAEIKSVEISKKIDEITKNELVKINSKKDNNYNILNIILVFIISFISLVILVDTFKTPISNIVPNIEFILYSLYESVKDIFLFLNDLI